MVRPVFQITRVEHAAQELHQALVLDLSAHDLQELVVGDMVEATSDVAFDEPLGPCPVLANVRERRVAARPGRKPCDLSENWGS